MFPTIPRMQASMALLASLYAGVTLGGESMTGNSTAPLADNALKTLPASQDPLAMTSLWQLTLGMLFVLGLIVGIAWLLKRTGRFQVGVGGGLRILGGLSMGSRERVVLIQAGETQLLVGVAPGRVQTLHVLDKPLLENTPATAGFAEQLSRIINKDKEA